jgi:DNA helicase-2/ATP-dependent DNA helicase PcrA
MGQYLVDFKGDTPHRASGSAAMQKPLRSTAVTGREKQSAPVQLSVGDRVRHMTFGEGTLLSVTPMGGDSLLEIAFDRVGTKKIMANFARIRKV